MRGRLGVGGGAGRRDERGGEGEGKGALRNEDTQPFIPPFVPDEALEDTVARLCYEYCTSTVLYSYEYDIRRDPLGVRVREGPALRGGGLSVSCFPVALLVAWYACRKWGGEGRGGKGGQSLPGEEQPAAAVSRGGGGGGCSPRLQ